MSPERRLPPTGEGRVGGRGRGGGGGGPPSVGARGGGGGGGQQVEGGFEMWC